MYHDTQTQKKNKDCVRNSTIQPKALKAPSCDETREFIWHAPNREKWYKRKLDNVHYNFRHRYKMSVSYFGHSQEHLEEI